MPYAFGMEHWKELLSQMKNVDDYTNQLFFGQSRVSQSWRAETLVKARAKLEIGIIRANEGGRCHRPWYWREIYPDYGASRQRQDAGVSDRIQTSDPKDTALATLRVATSSNPRTTSQI